MNDILNEVVLEREQPEVFICYGKDIYAMIVTQLPACITHSSTYVLGCLVHSVVKVVKSAAVCTPLRVLHGEILQISSYSRAASSLQIETYIGCNNSVAEIWSMIRHQLILGSWIPCTFFEFVHISCIKLYLTLS